MNKENQSFLLKLIKNKLVIGLVFLLSILVFNNFYSIQLKRKSVKNQITPEILSSEINTEDINEEDLKSAKAYIRFKKIKSAFLPTGIPEVYGRELGISFDKVQEAIDKVRVYGPTFGEEGKKITLTGEDLERYKKIGAEIACEYCCGVKTLTKEDGTAACGCAHSIMMRGLAAYLIKNHPEVSDDWILGQLETWKKTYFPKETLSKELVKMEKSGDLEIKEILKEFPDFLPQMVGGC